MAGILHPVMYETLQIMGFQQITMSPEAMMLAEMASDCGLPPGVLNVVHGGHDTVNFLCDNETRLHCVVHPICLNYGEITAPHITKGIFSKVA